MFLIERFAPDEVVLYVVKGSTLDSVMIYGSTLIKHWHHAECKTAIEN